MKKGLILLLIMGFVGIANAQESLNIEKPKGEKSDKEIVNFIKGLTIGVNVQAQWQYAQSKGLEAPQIGGNFGENSNNRFQLRRGYLRVGYASKYFSTLVQINATATGVSLVNAYAEVNSASKSVAFRVGQLYKPFGYFVYYSSSARMTPEVTRGEQSLFMNATGLGARLQLRDTRELWTRYFSLNLAYFSGDGQKKGELTPKDLITKLEYTYPVSNNIVVGAQFSGLFGTLTNTNDKIYSFNKTDNRYVSKEGVLGKKIGRTYYSLGATFQLNSCIGETKLFGEYMWGIQLAGENNNVSPGCNSTFTAPLYKRDFTNYYIYLQHRITDTNISLLLKYDSYDPNRFVKKDMITAASDVKFNTFAFGAHYRFLKHMSVSAYYEIVGNERTTMVDGFNNNRKDNMLTVRMQCAF